MSTDEQSQSRCPRSRKILESILADCLDSSSLLEIYYWTREPGMLDLIRAIAAMPEETRSALEGFFAMSHEPTAIAAKWDAAGRLTLASPQIGQTVAIMQYCAENEDAETPPMPN
ncbi:MAG: hypothetical protein ACJ8EN_22155 [Xanthobacteraceae bacterium]|jgi:hypothetical protein